MIRTRFAPSPTGRLHLGNVRTALFNALFAAQRKGDFVLRSEDTDAARSRASRLDEQIEDLRWLGLDWKEGPDVGGPHGPYRQSERGRAYAAYLERLLDEDRAYPCFCSAAELETRRAAAAAAGRPPRYAGTCAALARAEAERRLAAGEPASLRFRVPTDRIVAFDDLIRGEQHMAVDDIGDFVIRRTDGTPAFFFANAVDDALMEISHVLRGEDHLSNTPRQLLLLEALDLPAPAYGHLPLVLDFDGRPLSKRVGSASLETLRAEGILPAALANHLVRLGHAVTTPEFLSPAALIEEFDLARVGRAPAHHDPAQLAHWQRLAIRGLEPEPAAAWIGETGIPHERWTGFWELVRGNVATRTDATEWARRLAGVPEFDTDGRATLAATPSSLFAEAIDLSGEADEGKAVRALRERTGLRGARLYRALRTALVGRSEGPEVARLWTFFTRDERRVRFERARELCKGAPHATS